MIGRLRMASGLVLFTYVVLHLFNHSLLLVSMRFADTALQGFTAVWRSVPGTVLLSIALAVHLTLALGSLLRRRTLRMSRWEWAQLLLGLRLGQPGHQHGEPARRGEGMQVAEGHAGGRDAAADALGERALELRQRPGRQFLGAEFEQEVPRAHDGAPGAAARTIGKPRASRLS